MISVVIPTWNGRHLLESCLESLNRQTLSDFEIIIVDNGSTDGTVEWLTENHPGIICIGLEDNIGFSGGVNRGIHRADGSEIVLMNNDTVAEPTWLEALHEAAGDYPDYHIFASKVIRETDHRIDTVGDGFAIAGFGYKIGWMRSPEDPEFNSIQRRFGASGCSVLFRREVFEDIGDFDETFFAFAEDLDLSFRALLAGYRCLYVPDSVIYHAVRATAHQEKTLFWYHRNIIWLLYKNLPFPLWILYSPHILLHMILVAIRSACQGWLRVYLRSIREGLKGIRAKRDQRQLIQKMRRVPLKEVRRMMTGNWVRVHWQLSSIARKFRKAL